MKKQIKKKSLYENLQKDIRKLKTPEIEIWENMYADKNYWIEMDVPEFTCICPKTGMPDFAIIKIEYMPNKSCLELKSFKMYINSFRNVGIYHEHVVNKIMEDLVKTCKPRAMSIHGEFNLRGGIKTSVSAEYLPGKK